MQTADTALPTGKHFALTWGIPDNYGGMTAAMLHRSRAFVRLGGVEVDVLTVDDRPDYPQIEAELRASGALIDGMRLRNVWDDLRAEPPAAQEARIAPVELLVPEEGDRVARDGDVVLLRERRRADGSFLAADRFRRDGTLLATDRLVTGTRRIVVHGPDGAPLRQWGSTWKLFRWWLDRLIGADPGYIIVDSKTAARFVAGYRRAAVVTVHVVHGGHRMNDVPGSVRESREFALRRAGDYDGLVVLTARQRGELLADGFGAAARIAVIPNGVSLDAPSAEEHVRGQGVVLASLTARKRIAHAVRAAALAGGSDPAVTLDVYGEGEQEGLVRAEIDAADAGERIRLRGFDPRARKAFATADFSLLTSTTEGLPLVLAEAMAAGCLPIAYDIRYGPADLIVDGETGYLVPEGDVDAMAARILDLQRLSPEEVAGMRAAARARAQEFSDEAVTRRWGDELRAASAAKGRNEQRAAKAVARTGWVASAIRRRLRRVLGR